MEYVWHQNIMFQNRMNYSYIIILRMNSFAKASFLISDILKLKPLDLLSEKLRIFLVLDD